MASGPGFEPGTHGLTDRNSTTELSRNKFLLGFNVVIQIPRKLFSINSYYFSITPYITVRSFKNGGGCRNRIDEFLLAKQAQ